jgi:imidazolonepropionase-like amidohydrolase
MARKTNDAPPAAPICQCCDPALNVFTRRANTRLSRRGFVAEIVAAAGLGIAARSAPALAQSAQPPAILFENVRIFDGTADRLSGPSHVLVTGSTITRIADGPTAAAATGDAATTDRATIRIQGGGRTLMPGLIDAHTHLMFETIPQAALLVADIGFVNVAAVKAANDTLMRGFTSVRDLGGPVFGLKRGIDTGLVPGPRIWPSGAFISQTGGHGDFRLPTELPARPGDFAYSERIGAAAIADDAAIVRMRAREQLALGASQIKLMAGGGVASSFDPLDVTQYTVPELRAGVEAAENWGTYATVHAYTPRAVRQAIEAGVRCIDHGQLLDDATVALMAEKGIWWSLQPFLDDGKSAYAEGSPNRIKQLEMFSGTDTAYQLARKHGVRTAWGTDTLFDAAAAAAKGFQLGKMVRWYKPAEVLKMATSDNAALLALSGARSPYPGRLGVVQQGALADLLLVDGDPLTNIRLLETPETSFRVIVKDGRIHKNTL